MRKAVTAGDVLRDLFQHFLQLFGARLCRNHLHAAHNGQTGGQNDGELRANDGKLLVFDFLRADLFVPALRLFDFFYFGDDGAGLAQLRDRFKLVIRFDDAGKLCAVRGKPFVFIGRQTRSLAFFLNSAASSLGKRFSVSGVAERRFIRYGALAHHFQQGIIHRNAAVLRVHGNEAVNLRGLTLAD